MSERDPEVLSEEEAARLWERAAHLQVEAAKRVEAPDGDDASTPASGYALTHVRTAALEAGIAVEFLDAALADLRVERSVPIVGEPNSLARRFLNHPPDTLTAQRVIEATPEEVFTAMKVVLPEDPFCLTSIDHQGDPLNRGVLVFDIGGFGPPIPKGFAGEANWAGMRQVFISLRPVDGAVPSCEMTVYSPIVSHNLGMAQGVAVAILTGGLGLVSGILLTVATGLLPIVPVGGGVLLGSGLGVKGYRAIYAYCMRRGTKALEGLAGAVSVQAKGVWRVD